MKLFDVNDETKVINIKHGHDYDVYIGRGRCPKTGEFSIWGNPYSHIPGCGKYKVDNVNEAIEKYREYVLNNNYLMEQLPNLKGKILGCWCMPKNSIKGKLYCHGQVLIEILNNL